MIIQELKVIYTKNYKLKTVIGKNKNLYKTNIDINNAMHSMKII